MVLGSFSATIRHMLVTSLRRIILFKVFVLIIIIFITSRTIKILQFLLATFVCNEEVSTNLLHFRSLKDGQSGIEECVNNLKLNRAGLFSFQISDCTHFSAPSLKTDICHCVSLLSAKFMRLLYFLSTVPRFCDDENASVWVFQNFIHSVDILCSFKVTAKND